MTIRSPERSLLLRSYPPYHALNIDNASDESSAPKKPIGLASLIVLVFYTVSGGPFGIEDIVRAAGPRYALLGFTLILVWAVPEAMITSELSVAMPEASGLVNVEHFFMHENEDLSQVP